jgi:mono/diheme cytochrome c family protein
MMTHNKRNDTILSVISSGIPGTEMPAWNQVHGGPFTDEDIRQLVAFIRAWQPTATDARAAPPNGNTDRGRELYPNVCAVCHGDNGAGTAIVPALNDAQKLKEFDDAWYRDTIAHGRPDKGMPTRGTVLSPQQISDLIAMIDVWRLRAAAAATPAITATATTTTTAEVARPSKHPAGRGRRSTWWAIQAQANRFFVDNCQKCYGPQGTGGAANPDSNDGTIPPLNPIDATIVSTDPKVFATNIDLFIEHGSKPEGPNPKGSCRPGATTRSSRHSRSPM